MLFWLKELIGLWLWEKGYIVELTISYYPERYVYFGRTWWQFERDREFKELIRKRYPGIPI